MEAATELVFPFPKPEPTTIEEDRWIGDDTIAELGERGLLRLYGTGERRERFLPYLASSRKLAAKG